jgi:hypothetical protein
MIAKRQPGIRAAQHNLLLTTFETLHEAPELPAPLVVSAGKTFISG